MPLAAGDRIAHYEILALIGKGGMGEVYRARDTRLKRDVAVKVLPPAFANNPDRMARFQREAEVLASLNHPGIAAIYGVEERALIMEFVEGESPQGPLPFEEAWKIASQMAEALEYAHDKGVVHRDLKPANVKVTPDGVVKLLDFGLAKAFHDPLAMGASENPGDSPTVTLGATVAGTIIGTAAYMAPEQARGKRVDRRADIWSWGVVLWELLTGQRLFTGEEIQDVLAQVIAKEPNLDLVPVKARRMLRECLEKDPKQRLASIGDAKKFLEEPSSGPVTPAPDRRGWVLAAIALLAAAAVLWSFWPRQVELKPLVRLDADLGELALVSLFDASDVILSPDGARLVYVSNSRLLTRRLDRRAPMELAGTEGASSPFFSPDGQWVAFYADGKLKKVSVEGGAAIVLCDWTNPRGGDWGEDGNIIFSDGRAGTGLVRIPQDGGTPQVVTRLTQKEVTHRWPSLLPGGKAVLFTAHTSSTSGFDQATVDVASFSDGVRKTLQRGATFGRYLQAPDGSGYLIFVNRGNLLAAPFDANRLEVLGAPVRVLESVAYSTASGAAQLVFSRNGTLVYRAGGAVLPSNTVQWLDEGGRARPLLAKPGDYLRPRISPEGDRLAVTSQGDIWVYDTKRDHLGALTFGGGIASNVNPVWTPDGRYILFQATGTVSWIRADGVSKPQELLRTQNAAVPWSVSSDGKRLAYMEVSPNPGYDLWTVVLENGGSGLRAGTPEPFSREPFDERHPSFSPDGRWLAYSATEFGQFEVFVRGFPGGGDRWRVSDSGGVHPVWSPTGRELFYRTEDNRVMAAAYSARGDSFVPEKPRLWTQTRLANTGVVGTYDLAPDGKRIAAVLPAEPEGAANHPTHVTFLFNFADELRRRIPAGK